MVAFDASPRTLWVGGAGVSGVKDYSGIMHKAAHGFSSNAKTHQRRAADPRSLWRQASTRIGIGNAVRATCVDVE